MLRTTSKVLGSIMLVGILGLLPADRTAAACHLKTAPASEESANGKSTDNTSADRKTGDAKKRSRSKTKPARKRLPKYFAQLKLDDEQRQQILDIQERYAHQLKAKQKLLDETRKELDKLQRDQDRDYNRVLKTSQKRRLKELRNRKKRSARRKAKGG